LSEKLSWQWKGIDFLTWLDGGIADIELNVYVAYESTPTTDLTAANLLKAKASIILYR
jgi:hypothetical protein